MNTHRACEPHDNQTGPAPSPVTFIGVPGVGLARVPASMQKAIRFLKPRI